MSHMNVPCHEGPMQERLISIYQHSHDLLMTLDGEGRFKDWSRSAADYFAEITPLSAGLAFAELIGDEHWDNLWNQLKALPAGESLTNVHFNITFNQGKRSMNLTIAVLRGESGEMTYQCVGQDTSALEPTESMLQQAHKLDCIGRLMAGVAHDYNNMLLVIQGQLGLLTQRAILSSSVIKALTEIGRAANRGYELNKQLLLFSRKTKLNRLIDAEKEPSIQPLQGFETILLVEDDLAVQNTIFQALTQHGYNVIACESSDAALRSWKVMQSRIDLLFTDIVIPGALLGDELADRLLREKPGLKVLYTTGYNDRIIGIEAKLGVNSRLIMKPYNHLEMLMKVQDLLHQ